jgi:hypothetical protein
VSADERKRKKSSQKLPAKAQAHTHTLLKRGKAFFFALYFYQNIIKSAVRQIVIYIVGSNAEKRAGGKQRKKKLHKII